MTGHESSVQRGGVGSQRVFLGMNTITQGTWVVVTRPDQFDHERPHQVGEDGMRGLVTDDGQI